MSPEQQERALCLLLTMAFDDGPKWRDQLSRSESFLDFWLRWRNEVLEFQAEIEGGVPSKA